MNTNSTDSAMDYKTALSLRMEAAGLLNAADYHDESGDKQIAASLRDKATAIYESIPAEFQDRSDDWSRVERFGADA